MPIKVQITQLQQSDFAGDFIFKGVCCQIIYLILWFQKYSNLFTKKVNHA